MSFQPSTSAQFTRLEPCVDAKGPHRFGDAPGRVRVFPRKAWKNTAG
jgi:hypothetical protein